MTPQRTIVSIIVGMAIAEIAVVLFGIEMAMPLAYASLAALGVLLIVWWLWLRRR